MDSCFIITYSKNNMFVDVINLLYRYNFFVRYTSNKKNQGCFYRSDTNQWRR